MPQPIRTSLANWPALLSAIMIAFVFYGGEAAPVAAQSAWESSAWQEPEESQNPSPWDAPSTLGDEPRRGSQPSGSASGVPRWAAPYEPIPAQPPSGGKHGYDVPRFGGNEGPVFNSSGPGGGGSPVGGGGGGSRNIPLGGLEWLLAAGAGYAAHRLRNRSEDDDDTASA